MGFGLFALGILLITDDLVIPITFDSMAMLSYFFVATLYTQLAQYRLRQIVKSKMGSTSIGDRSVIANEKGLQLIAGELYSEVPWSIVQDVVETPSHVFVAIDNTYSLVIPKKEVEGDALNQFVAMLRQKILRADTSAAFHANHQAINSRIRDTRHFDSGAACCALTDE